MFICNDRGKKEEEEIRRWKYDRTEWGEVCRKKKKGERTKESGGGGG